MISRKTTYGLQSMLRLAKEYEKGPLLIEDLSKKERLPKKFLEAILLDLKNHGLLQSKKGKGGGYMLARHPREITMGEVIEVLEGPLTPSAVLNETAENEANEETSCCIRLVMDEVQTAISKILDSTTLEAALHKSYEVLQKKTINFHI